MRLLLRLVAVGVLVFEAADLLGGGLLEGLLHGVHFADLGVLADGPVDEVQNGLLAGFQILEEAVLVSLVPVEDVVVELDESLPDELVKKPYKLPSHPIRLQNKYS